VSVLFCFFFSSRRRHTRSDRDWSSDVCSSDLWIVVSQAHRSLSPFLRPSCRQRRRNERQQQLVVAGNSKTARFGSFVIAARSGRSEERRVGKEWKAWWVTWEEKEKEAERERR